MTVSLKIGTGDTYVLDGTDGAYTVAGDVTISRTANFDNMSIGRAELPNALQRIMNTSDVVRIDAKVSETDLRDVHIPYFPYDTIISAIKAEATGSSHYIYLPGLANEKQGLVQSITYTHRPGGQLVDVAIVFEIGTVGS